MIDAFVHFPALYLSSVFVFGLIAGSFINVVILRLPAILEAGWRAGAAEILDRPAPEGTAPDLVRSRSACPHCGNTVRAWHNIPVLSFLWLRGRCADCGGRISWQYPAVELAAALLAVAVAWRFGVGLPALLALAYTGCLLALTGIDWRTQYLPDALTLPLLWLGLLASLGGYFATPADAIAGAAAGYLLLWGVYHAFRLVTGKEGMGYGDFKLLAAIGAWLGWQSLPLVILLASAVGAALGIALSLTGRLGRDVPLPFGPFLAAAGWLALVAGDTIAGAYFQIAGFN